VLSAQLTSARLVSVTSTMIFPAFDDLSINAEQIERTTDRLGNDVIDCRGHRVEGRHRRHNDSTVLRGPRHQCDVAGVKRRFPKKKDNSAALFQADIRGADYELVGDAMSDAAEGTHRAGSYQHTFGSEGAARNWRTNIPLIMGHACERTYLVN
jgi:hypothetical protein